MYPHTGLYGAPSPQKSQPPFPAHCTLAPNKGPLTNNSYTANYYHNNQQQHHLPQHQVSSNIAPSAPSGEPQSFATRNSDLYGTIPATFPISASPPPSPPPPPTEKGQGSPQSFQQPDPNGTPYYGQKQYQAPQTQHTQQQQLSFFPVPQSCPGAPVYPIVSYPSAPGSSQYGTLQDSKTAVASAIPNLMKTPLHGYVANIGASSGIATRPSAQAAAAAQASAPLSPTPDDTGDTSSSTISASPMPNSYNCSQRGSEPDSMPPSYDAANQANSNHGCQNMQLTYQQHPVSQVNLSPSHGGYGQSSYQQYSQPFPNLSQSSVSDALRPLNLLQERNLLPPRPLEAPEPNLRRELKMANCSPQTFRCTLTSVPKDQALLRKSSLPLGLLLHPFRDSQQVPTITSNTIVRCLSCGTYLNPFVSFLDDRRWTCNLCCRVNCVPDEVVHEYNPETRSYGELRKRPEVRNSTVEFIASSNYMSRPPQPAVYLFVLDVSYNAVEVGYLKYFCESLLENLDRLPGDTRTRVGFVTFDSTVHFYNLQEGLSRPQMMVVSDIEDVFIPSHDSLMVNLKESKELVKDLLKSLPSTFSHNGETHSALGPALQAAYKLMYPTGGRVSVFQSQLPTLGAGLLQSREQGSGANSAQHPGPATDFYKKLALDCSSQQIAVDLFLLSSQYADLASLACVSKYSAGSIFYYPSFHHVQNPAQLEKFQKDVEHYLTRTIGFEAEIRIRCTKGLSIHSFHGNFFVRSTDRLSLANVNPDSAFAVQVTIEDSLADYAYFQAALLYTSSKGTKCIRVHTLCLPVVNQLSDVYAGADVQAITCLLANMAVDRSVSSSLSDARDTLVKAVVDFLEAYKGSMSNMQQSGLVAPASLRLFPLYVLALLKQKALRMGSSTRLDERVFAMCEFKTQPLEQMMRRVHPDLYRLDNMSDQGALRLNETVVPQPHLLHLSAEWLSRDGVFLMDCGDLFYLWIGKCCDEMFIRDVLGCPNYASIPLTMTQIPELHTSLSVRVRAFLGWLRDQRPFSSTLYVIKDGASVKTMFLQQLVEDRSEASFSYLEFLQHIERQISK